MRELEVIESLEVHREVACSTLTHIENPRSMHLAARIRVWPESSQVKACSSWRQNDHMQRQRARMARRGWCAGVVPTAPRSLERTRRDMRQAKPPARGGAARASLGLLVVLGCALSCSLRGVARVQGRGCPISLDQWPKPRKEG